MNELWSYSTTIREAERIVDFLKTAKRIDGKEWNKDTQCMYQAMLIQDRYYLNDETNSQNFNKLNEKQCQILINKDYQMSYEEAFDIFTSKQYNDPPMRGRQSMSPLIKLGLAYKSTNPDTKKSYIHISPLGNMVLDGELPIEDFFLDSLLKFQYPNPASDSNPDYNTKPFINTLRLIKEVNRLCEERGEKAKGIHRIEFGIFALSIQNYEDIPAIANKLLKFRDEYNKIKDNKHKKYFVNNYILNYLDGYKKPEKNVFEYTDNLIRYLRMTKYIIVRGKYEYVYFDLAPSRKVEIDAILEKDNGSAKKFSCLEEWQEYIGTYGTYTLPFESDSKLQGIYNLLLDDIEGLATQTHTKYEPFEAYTHNKVKDKETIANMRTFKTKLQNTLLNIEYKQSVEKVNEAIEMLDNIYMKKELTYKPPLELEKWSNVALNIIDDCVEIKPNTVVGDDNEPISTAPAGVADIECFYGDFNAICEVTMLTSRDQWFNEGQPVMRHLSQFKKKYNKDSYCLFVAPRLHDDTLNTFYMSVKYEYNGEKQKIIPITITELKSLLEIVKKAKEKKKKITHDELKNFYDKCCDIKNINNTQEWRNLIVSSINSWRAAF